MRTVMCIGFCVLIAISSAGCKKPAPVHPYDVKMPPFKADILIQAVDITTAVGYLDYKLYDPDGEEFTGMTDNTGRLAFNFPDMKRGVWRAYLPKQGRYFDSEVKFEAKEGLNSVRFVSDPTLTLSPVSPVTYSYSTQTDIILDLKYEQGGALRVPVTIVGSGIPGGWNMSYTPMLGRETNSGTVTLQIPPGQYVQPVIDFFGLTSGTTIGVPTTYVATNFVSAHSSVTISRGYPIVMSSSLSWTGLHIGSQLSITGTLNLSCPNGANIPWIGDIHIGASTNHDRYWSYIAYAFTGSAAIAWSATIPYSANPDTYGVGFHFNLNSPLGPYDCT